MRKPRFKAAPDAPVAFYHCISRIVDRAFKLGSHEKEVFVRILRQYESFCGVQVLTYAVLANHFHVLVEVPRRPDVLPSDEALFARLEALYTPEGVVHVRQEWDALAALADPQALAQLRESFFARMWDVSQFMKAVKQRFSQWYNGQQKRKGTLWEERFRSVLVEGTPEALSVLAAYIDLNAVRAGIVHDPKDYRWCGYAEAVSGNRRQAESLLRVLPPGNEDMAAYRRLLYAAGVRRGVGTTGNPVRRGFTAAEVAAAWKEEGKLTIPEALGCRVRYFVDGAVLGSRLFVEEVFARCRAQFSATRKSGSRPLRGIATELFCLRALRLRAIGDA